MLWNIDCWRGCGGIFFSLTWLPWLGQSSSCNVHIFIYIHVPSLSNLYWCLPLAQRSHDQSRPLIVTPPPPPTCGPKWWTLPHLFTQLVEPWKRGVVPDWTPDSLTHGPNSWTLIVDPTSSPNPFTRLVEPFKQGVFPYWTHGSSTRWTCSTHGLNGCSLLFWNVHFFGSW